MVVVSLDAVEIFALIVGGIGLALVFMFAGWQAFLGLIIVFIIIMGVYHVISIDDFYSGGQQ